MRRVLLIAVGVVAHLAMLPPAGAGESAAQFSPPVRVQILGYNSHAMEPFLTRDGKLLFFNNRNDPKDQTDLHVARRIDETSFRYLGPLTGANSDKLDGVASLDRAGNFYLVSARDYDSTGNTLWSGRYSGGAIGGMAPLVTDFTPRKLLRLNIDLEVSADGNTLYVAENRWDLLRGVPATSDITMARKTAAGFARLPDADALMANINTPHLEFAPATSADELTLYFTRLNMKALRKGKANAFTIMVATRADRTSPWGVPQSIAAISGHAEAPTVTPDGCAIYFHRKDAEIFHLYLTRRTNCTAH